MYLLDTNVVSELRRPHPHPAVVEWIEQVAADELLLSAVTVGEIQAGIELTREQDIAKAEELEDAMIAACRIVMPSGVVARIVAFGCFQYTGSDRPCCMNQTWLATRYAPQDRERE